MRLHVCSPFCHWRPAWCAEQTLQPLLLGGLQHLSNMSGVLGSVLGWVYCSSCRFPLPGKLFFLTTQKSIFVVAIGLCCCPSTRSAQSVRRRASKDQSASLFLVSCPPLPLGLDWMVVLGTEDIFRGTNCVWLLPRSPLWPTLG